MMNVKRSHHLDQQSLTPIKPYSYKQAGLLDYDQEQVSLPVIKTKLNKFKKIKRKRIKSPSLREDQLISMNMAHRQTKQQNLNYEYEERQNNKIAKLLNIDFSDSDLNREAQNVKFPKIPQNLDGPRDIVKNRRLQNDQSVLSVQQKSNTTMNVIHDNLNNSYRISSKNTTATPMLIDSKTKFNQFIENTLASTTSAYQSTPFQDHYDRFARRYDMPKYKQSHNDSTQYTPTPLSQIKMTNSRISGSRQNINQSSNRVLIQDDFVWQNNIPVQRIKPQYTMEQLEEMQHQRETKMREHQSRVKFIVEKLTGSRKTNRFCPCCSYKYDSPYEQPVHHHTHHKRLKSRNASFKNNQIITSQNNNIHLMSDNNIMSLPSHNLSFLRKGESNHHHHYPNDLSNNSFKLSHTNSPRFGKKKMSQEVKTRLYGSQDSRKKICSTNHNHMRPIDIKREQLSPLLKPRPLSAEKILKHDISLSPIQFSQLDADNQVSEHAFSAKIKFNELEIQTGNHLLDNFRWKEERSIEIGTEPIVEVKLDQQLTIEMNIVKEKKIKQQPTLKYDWAESEIFKSVNDKHQQVKEIQRRMTLRDKASMNMQQDSMLISQNSNNQKELNKSVMTVGGPSLIDDKLLDAITQMPITNSNLKQYQDKAEPNNNDGEALEQDSLNQENLQFQVANQPIVDTEEIKDLDTQLMTFNKSRNDQQEGEEGAANLVQNQNTHKTAVYIEDNYPANSDSMNNRESGVLSQDQPINFNPDNEILVISKSIKNISAQKQLITKNLNQNSQDIALSEKNSYEINTIPLNELQISNVNNQDSNKLGNGDDNSLTHPHNPLDPLADDELLQFKHEIYTEIEATYKASLLKKKAKTYNNPENLLEFHVKAKRTIEVLTYNMIQADVSLDRIFEYYEDINRPNVIKMLLRCRLLYQARVDVRKILQLIIKKEEMYEELSQIMMLGEKNLKRIDPLQLSSLIDDGLRLIQRLLSSISNFKHEHKIFKGQFLFKGQDYSETLVQQRNQIQDFVWESGLQETMYSYRKSDLLNRTGDRFTEFKLIKDQIENDEQNLDQQNSTLLKEEISQENDQIQQEPLLSSQVLEQSSDIKNYKILQAAMDQIQNDEVDLLNEQQIREKDQRQSKDEITIINEDQSIAKGIVVEEEKQDYDNNFIQEEQEDQRLGEVQIQESIDFESQQINQDMSPKPLSVIDEQIDNEPSINHIEADINTDAQVSRQQSVRQSNQVIEYEDGIEMNHLKPLPLNNLTAQQSEQNDIDYLINEDVASSHKNSMANLNSNQVSMKNLNIKDKNDKHQYDDYF
ncbi:UNKNOWN [Stylonychia lemnae]|uniref:Uncharacterized protein n=1 Tax=Stylonychia lemnae TaxID=5949 RepID=A0A078A8C9_STYLE|nr:UNKNOWN [Stylonychia lemnae]|eukprot:CDW77827.1 UNKNOWN [Stylonychia lemnae]